MKVNSLSRVFLAVVGLTLAGCGGDAAEETPPVVEPGPHRVIAVLADLAHIPLDPLVADTVTFRVGG